MYGVMATETGQIATPYDTIRLLVKTKHHIENITYIIFRVIYHAVIHITLPPDLYAAEVIIVSLV